MTDDNSDNKKNNDLNVQLPGKVNLDKDLIIDKVLIQIARGGVNEVSFRKLASELNVSPMAIYRYFDDKSELLAETLDEFISRADVMPSDNLIWDEWFRELVINMYLTLKEDVKWVPIFTEVQFLPNGLSVMEAAMKKLLDAGFTEKQSVENFLAGVQTMLGACVLFSTTQNERPIERLAKDFEPEKYPYISRISGLMWGEQHYNFFKGLDLILQGMHVQLKKNQ